MPPETSTSALRASRLVPVKGDGGAGSSKESTEVLRCFLGPVHGHGDGDGGVGLL